METTIALIGAGGKMGCRLTDNLKHSSHTVYYVEVGEAGVERLKRRGLAVTPLEEALKQAEVVILAVPDILIGKVASVAVPLLKSGAIVMCLDPAAPQAGVLPERQDITYFVTHPCHPPVVNDETDPDAKLDFFGAVRAKQNIVCALMQGPEPDYFKGEQICREMFAPVMSVHRITVEQMAILEPALSETVVATCFAVIMEAIDEAVRRGVPRDAAVDFILGHIWVDIGIFFGFADAVLSDGAKKAVERGRQNLFKEDWKKVFEPENIMAEIRAITGSRGTPV